MDLDSGFHTQAPVFISSNLATPHNSSSLSHTHTSGRSTQTLCPMPVPKHRTAVKRMREEPLSTSCSHLHRVNRPLTGVYVNKFSSLTERHGVKQRHEKSSPQAEKYPTPSSIHHLPKHAWRHLPELVELLHTRRQIIFMDHNYKKQAPSCCGLLLVPLQGKRSLLKESFYFSWLFI